MSIPLVSLSLKLLGWSAAGSLLPPTQTISQLVIGFPFLASEHTQDQILHHVMALLHGQMTARSSTECDLFPTERFVFDQSKLVRAVHGAP